MVKIINCIECPKGCEIHVELENCEIKQITGYSCERGKAYASEEVVCPKRVITSTVKTSDGRVVSVKTDKPVKKTEIFDVMKKISAKTVDKSAKIGDIVIENIAEGVNLVATNNMEII